MKIYVNRAPVRGAWGGGNQWVKAFHEFLPELKHGIVQPDDQMTAPDLIVLAGLDNDGVGISADHAVMYKEMMKDRHDVRLVLRVNENDARKGTSNVDRYLISLSQYLDGTVFVSDWLHDYFITRGWKCKNNVVIKNGVQSSVFKPGVKLDNGKVNIVSAHWSDNYMKGQDVTEWLDGFVGKHHNEFSFTFIGRTQANLKNGTLIRPLFGAKLGEEMGKFDVCINGTRFDPGPNSVIEPISCGLPTYVHIDGGGAVEFAGNDHTFSDLGELEVLLLSKSFKANTTNFTSWKTTIKQFVTYLESVCTQAIV